MKRSLLTVCALTTGVVLALGTVPATSAPDNQNSTNNNSAKLRNAVTVAGILEHEESFQKIADAGGSNRLAGAPGYE
ncbi:MAG: aminopeptidase, partial [Jiangellaceae bacterium]